jgi:protein-tyrosine phosphatase
MKLLMVCLGNICRSPMAEGIMRERAHQRGMALEIDSAGTGNYHIGDGPDPRAVQCLKGKGIDIAPLRARQFSIDDFDAFDIIFAMDQSNYDHIIAKARHEADVSKVRMILDEHESTKGSIVPDPYFGEMDGFETVYSLVDQACEAFLDKAASKK